MCEPIGLLYCFYDYVKLGSLLYTACRKGDEKTVKELLSKGADPSWISRTGWDSGYLEQSFSYMERFF